mgnify:FL=1|tara:strand:- start:12364 stop:13635 length:1272 start_codon:yes stop_codon:yes gene_type:complete
MAKRETTIAKEIAIAEKLIRRKSTSDTLKKKLKSKVDRLKKEARGIPMTAKQLASANLRQRAKLKELSKRDFNDLVRRLSKKKEYTFLKGMSLDEVVRDMARKAKPVGWRFKGQGNYKTPSAAQVKKGRASGDVYYEARPNRSDVSQSTRLETGGEISSDQAYYMADVIADNLKDAGMCEDARKCRDVIEKAIMGIEYFPFARYTFEDEPVYAKRGGKQGYNDRDDESLGMSHGGSMSQGMKSRRDESKGMRKSMGERAYRDDQMGKGGIISVGNTVMVRDSGKSMKVTDIAKNSKGQIEFSGALGSFLIGDLRKKSTMEKGGNVPKGVMTLKEWVENTELDEVGKYVKSKLKKPETQIYVIGEEDEYAIKIDTDWKEDKPLTDEEGSEHTLYIGKDVVEVETDGEFTNTFFTKDANFKITKS